MVSLMKFWIYAMDCDFPHDMQKRGYDGAEMGRSSSPKYMALDLNTKHVGHGGQDGGKTASKIGILVRNVVN